MRTSNRGYALLSVLSVVAALLVAGAATISLVRSQLRFTADQTAVQTAYYVAEAGIQRGIAQFDNDAATATTAGYVYPTIATTSFGGGSYAVTLAQDPLYSSPLNRTRKQITSTGTFKGMPATLVAHVLVQAPMTGPGDPCYGNVLVSNGNAHLNYLAAVTSTLFNGNIVSKNDVHFNAAVGLPLFVPAGIGKVSAVNNFYSDTLLVTSVPHMSAALFRGGSFNIGLDLFHTTGFHFSNGTNGHGLGPALASPSLPVPDWDSAKRDSHTQIVSQDNYATVAPGSSWSGGTNGTWTVSTFSLGNATRYYVDGSANVTGLQLLGNRSAELWARGSITVRTFSLLSAGSSQNLMLHGGGNVVVGTGSPGSGLITALSNTNFLAYSSGGAASVDSGVNAAVDTHACILGGGSGSPAGDATYQALTSLLSTLKPLYP